MQKLSWIIQMGPISAHNPEKESSPNSGQRELGSWWEGRGGALLLASRVERGQWAKESGRPLKQGKVRKQTLFGPLGGHSPTDALISAQQDLCGTSHLKKCKIINWGTLSYEVGSDLLWGPQETFSWPQAFACPALLPPRTHSSTKGVFIQFQDMTVCISHLHSSLFLWKVLPTPHNQPRQAQDPHPSTHWAPTPSLP